MIPLLYRIRRRKRSLSHNATNFAHFQLARKHYGRGCKPRPAQRGCKPRPAQARRKHYGGVANWADENVANALKKLIPFLFPSFYNQLIFLIKKICGTKTGSQSASLFVTFSSAQLQTPSGAKGLQTPSGARKKETLRTGLQTPSGARSSARIYKSEPSELFTLNFSL